MTEIHEPGTDHVVLTFIADGPTLHILGAPDGRVDSLRPIGVFTPDWTAVDEAIGTIRSHMEHASDRGELTVAAYDQVVRSCAFLFDELVPPTAKVWLRGRPGTLSVSLPATLLHVPWELLHTGESFLGARWALGRLVQPGADPHPARPAPDERPSVLVIADPDGGLPEAYDEGVTLADGLRTDGATQVALRTTDVDAAFLRTELRAHDVLHYAGHVDRDGWRMSESTFGRTAIDKLGGGAPLPALVFANGCASAAADEFAGSMLEGWIVGGARHVIGPLFELPDALGRRFSSAFYGALFAGAPVGEAVRRARGALAEELGDGVIPWGAYVLYGDPGFTYGATDRSREQPILPAPAPVRLSDRNGDPVALRSAVSIDTVAAVARGPRVRMTTAVYIALLILALAAAAVAVGIDSARAPSLPDWPAESGL